jgi:hypothetical protein
MISTATLTTLNTLSFIGSFGSSFGAGDLNPGNPSAFPWLANVAVNFEKWKMLKCSYHFVSTNPTSTAGRIYASFDYDYDDTVPTTAMAAMSSMTAVEAPCYVCFSLPIDCRRMQEDMPYRYVNTIGRATGVEMRMCYGGFLTLMANVAASCTWDVYCEYSIELSIPVLEAQFYLPSDSFSSKAAASTTSVFPAVGTAWATGLADLVKGASGLDVGAPGTRQFPIPIGWTPGTGLPGNDWMQVDIRPQQRGTLGMLMDTVVTGQTPASLMQASRMAAAVLSSDGTYLATLDPMTGTANCKEFGQCGVPAYSTATTASAATRFILEVSMAALKAVYPTAAFVVAYAIANAATWAGAGSRRSGLVFQN